MMAVTALWAFVALELSIDEVNWPLHTLALMGGIVVTAFMPTRYFWRSLIAAVCLAVVMSVVVIISPVAVGDGWPTMHVGVRVENANGEAESPPRGSVGIVEFDERVNADPKWIAIGEEVPLDAEGQALITAEISYTIYDSLFITYEIYGLGSGKSLQYRAEDGTKSYLPLDGRWKPGESRWYTLPEGGQVEISLED